MKQNAAGGYRFIPMPGRPFSGGVAADSGFELVRVVLVHPVRLEHGFDLMRDQLAAAGRPPQAFCAAELRVPRPLAPEDFATFNATYVQALTAWGVGIDGEIPTARTNVAHDPRW